MLSLIWKVQIDLKFKTSNIPPWSNTIYFEPFCMADIFLSPSPVDSTETGTFLQYRDAASGSKASVSWFSEIPACNGKQIWIINWEMLKKMKLYFRRVVWFSLVYWNKTKMRACVGACACACACACVVHIHIYVPPTTLIVKDETSYMSVVFRTAASTYTIVMFYIYISSSTSIIHFLATAI
jgi:hypothetical protein